MEGFGNEESKWVQVTRRKVNSIWSNRDLEFDFVASSGNSGGLVSIWDPSLFNVSESFKGAGYLITMGTWVNADEECMFINIYAPQQPDEKRKLWAEIKRCCSIFNGLIFVFGDFNAVRRVSERVGSQFITSAANDFNSFIMDARLVEVKKGGRRYTRISRDCTKLSKLDRVLVSNNAISLWPSIRATVLPKRYLDHCPIFLKISKLDYGPIPFWFCNVWLEEYTLSPLISSVWNTQCSISQRPDVQLKTRFRKTKFAIKNWYRELKQGKENQKWDILNRLKEFQKNVESGSVEVGELHRHSVDLIEIYKLEQTNFRSLRQRAKCKWASLESSSLRPTFRSFGFKRLSEEQRHELEKPFSSEEVKAAVWSCGSDKTPGPDGFSFKFIKRFLNVVSSDIMEFLKFFEKGVGLARGCNPSFISLIPKVCDPMTPNNYRPINLLGCQYKILAKVLANRLALVLPSIISNLQSAYVKERQIMDGPLICVGSNGFWKHGDPLSPFLFIIVVEALNVALIEARSKGIFKGVQVSPHSTPITHLQFADDALFLGEWSELNVMNLIRILRCFNMASGLKINLSKSKVLGVGVNPEEVSRLAQKINCMEDKLPFTYLGLPIGSSMRNVENWNPIIQKFHNRLSDWKAKNMSMGGRVTLIKFLWCGNSENKKIHWVSWNQSMAKIKSGGLGFRSLKAYNLALLAKWWWRVRIDRDSLWASVIDDIYGNLGGDLYPVTQQPSFQTLVILLSFSSTTWHRRLGHPREDVLLRLESKAMLDEYNALITNGTWVLVPRPTNVNVVRSMWLFKHKFHVDGTLSRYKARLVANGRSQQQGIDCDETFSLVVKPATIRTVLSLSFSHDWPIYQLDMKNAFLHGQLSKTVYMHQPSGFVDSARPDYVCHLQKSLYGLKHTPQACFCALLDLLHGLVFKTVKPMHHYFFIIVGLAYLLLYVDDIILTASSTALLQRIIDSLHGEFAMTDLGSLKYFLGISA
ncbi:RNA-directed DNA polymerase, eukaryota [Tanacetum coccineum]